MEKMRYESPEFNFQEMQLMETVADTCWGYKYGWYDIDRDGEEDPNETRIHLSEWGSCNDVAVGLPKYLKDKFGVDADRNDVKENSHSQLVRPVVS